MWKDEAWFASESVFNIHSSHVSARDNPHDIRERGCEVLSASVLWAGIVGDNAVCPILLPDKLTDNLYRDFSGNCSTGAS
jgi:hypothetical protein